MNYKIIIYQFLFCFLVYSHSLYGMTCGEFLGSDTDITSLFNQNEEGTNVNFLGYKFITKKGSDSDYGTEDGDLFFDYHVDIVNPKNNRKVGSLFGRYEFASTVLNNELISFLSIKLPISLRRKGIEEQFINTFFKIFKRYETRQSRIRNISVNGNVIFDQFKRLSKSDSDDHEAASLTPIGMYMSEFGFEVESIDFDGPINITPEGIFIYFRKY